MNDKQPKLRRKSTEHLTCTENQAAIHRTSTKSTENRSNINREHQIRSRISSENPPQHSESLTRHQISSKCEPKPAAATRPHGSLWGGPAGGWWGRSGRSKWGVNGGYVIRAVPLEPPRPLKNVANPRYWLHLCCSPHWVALIIRDCRAYDSSVVVCDVSKSCQTPNNITPNNVVVEHYRGEFL